MSKTKIQNENIFNMHGYCFFSFLFCLIGNLFYRILIRCRVAEFMFAGCFFVCFCFVYVSSDFSSPTFSFLTSFCFISLYMHRSYARLCFFTPSFFFSFVAQILMHQNRGYLLPVRNWTGLIEIFVSTQTRLVCISPLIYNILLTTHAHISFILVGSLER